ncbi:MAG: methyltransferase [Oscillospiraceae bacterium]|jgi:16S rRNA (guanine1207-N2)-methyltransferase|nr:methyltransferase [Oscillospiraceae bacterium]
MSHYFTDDPALPDDFRQFPYYYGDIPFTFTSNSGVFSPGHVDPETDLLIKTLPPLRGSFLDLACGYGPIGIVMAKANRLLVTMSDVSERALRCARSNCAANGVTAEVKASFCFERIRETFDTIALNPPIHAGKEVTHRMFAEAPAHLNPGGAFYVVMLEKYGAKSARGCLEAAFGNCEIVYRKKGEYVFCCRK